MYTAAKALLAVCLLVAIQGCPRPTPTQHVEPAQNLGSMIGSSWILFDEPRSEVEPGWVVGVPGLGTRSDCFQHQGVIHDRGWDEYGRVVEHVSSGGLALRLLQYGGMDIDLTRYRSMQVRTTGWTSRRALNLQPQPGPCFVEASPVFPAMGEILWFDTLRIEAVERNGRQVVLNTDEALRQVAGTGVDAHWRSVGNNTFVARGHGIAVAFRAVLWQAVGGLNCGDYLPLTPGAGMNLVCQGRLRAGIQEVGEDGTYRIMFQETGPGATRTEVNLFAGEKVDIIFSPVRWAWLSIDSVYGDRVKISYANTPYAVRPVTRMDEVTGELRNILPVIDIQANPEMGVSPPRGASTDRLFTDPQLQTAARLGDALWFTHQSGQFSTQTRTVFNSVVNTVVSEPLDVANHVSGRLPYVVHDQCTIMFDRNQYRAAMERYGECEAMVELHRDGAVLFSVAAYADATGSLQYNDSLSQRRADAVARWLIQRFDLPPTRVSWVGTGSTDKFGAEWDGSGPNPNRRATVYVLGME